MFAAAKKEAEAFGELIETGGETQTKLETVEDSCREYAKDRPEADERFRRHVFEDPIAKIKLEKLRRHHLRDCRKRL